MKDEDIVRARRESEGASPVEIAERLGGLVEGGLTQSSFVSYFSRSFLAIPLQVLLDAGAWFRLTGGDLGDDAFNVLLEPYLGAAKRSTDP